MLVIESRFVKYIKSRNSTFLYEYANLRQFNRSYVRMLNDFVYGGFSNEKGESIGGSLLHKNGYNGDFRYLRKDHSGQKLFKLRKRK